MVMSPTVLSEQILMDCIHEEHNIFKINYAKELKEMTCASQAELAAVNEASLKEMWSSCVKFVEGIIKKIGELVEAGIGKITIAIGQMERNAKAIKTALSTGKWKEQKVEFKIRSIRKDKIDKMTISSFAGLNRAAIDETKEVNKDEITRNLWKTVGRTYSESMSMQDAIIDEYTSDVDYALTDSSSVSTYLDDMIAGKSVIGGLRKSYSIVKSEFAKIVNDAKKAANNVSEDAESYKYAKNAYTIATMESAFYTSWFKTMISVVTSCLISENNSIMKVAKKCMGHTAAADKKQSNNQQAVNASAIEGGDNMISTVQHEEQFDDTKNTDYLNKIRQCAINYYKESIDNNDIKSWNNELGEMWSDYKNTYNNIVKKKKIYTELADKYKEHLGNYDNKVDNSFYNAAKLKKEIAEQKIKDGIRDADDRISKMRNTVKEIEKKAGEAKKAVEEICNSFDKLEKKKKNWQDGIDKISGESKASMQADLDSEAKEINKKDAEECFNNLSLICDVLERLKKDIKKLSFKKNEAVDAAKSNCDNNDIDNIAERKDYANNYYDSKYKEKFISVKNFPEKIDEQNNKFYKYLKKLFGNPNNGNKNNKEKEKYEDTKNKLLKTDSDPGKSVEDVKSCNGTTDDSGKADTSTNNNEDIKAKYSSPALPSVENPTGTDNPSNTSVDGKNLSQSIGNAADSSIIEKLTSFNITKCVEDVYLTEYVMNMFTYRTYNKDHDGKDIDSGSLKTLSNCSYITGSILNGAEAEYVLWGLGSKKSNLDATYATIYGIRFLMNTVYAFMDKNIRIETTSVATAIAGWTGFGVPIVKAALTVGLALLESKLDMDALLKGKSVPVWKDSNTWTCSLSGFMNKAANELISIAVDKAQDAASKAIDKIYNCASDKINEMSGEISESLQGMAMEAINSVVNNVTAVVESKIMGIFSYGTDFTDVEEKDQLREDIEKWRNDLRETLGVPDSPPSIQENLPDYLLYIAYNEVINTANFINRVVDEIWNNYKDATSETAQELVKKLEKTVFDICKIKKNDEGKIIEVFGKNVAELINDSVSSVNSKIQGYMAEGSEKAKENVCNAISGYGNKLVSSKYKTPSAGSTGTGSSSKSWASSITMDYSEYLTMLLILTGVLEDGYEKHLLRTADLIQINTSIAKKNDKFALKNCKTHLQIKAVASGSIFFAGSKYLQETENIYLKKSNGLYGINYNGVDGY